MAYTTINKSSDYFNTKLYTGNATNPTTISGIGFQPDWVWTKGRSAAEGNRLCDAVRGATKDLISNTTAAETTNAIGLKSFNSDGYVIGNSNGYNQNSQTFVSWNWKANGQGSSNTAGSINTTYTSVNTTAGLSISTYTGQASAGATFGHGLGVKPAMIIFKCVSVAGPSWVVYHQSKGATYTLYLDQTSPGGTSAEMLNNTEPTSSLITLGNSTSSNSSGASTIAYCFAEKTGYSKFGSYVGNGNNNGSFIYTGFKPAFTIIKNTTTAGYDWVMDDVKRSPFNEMNNTLYANANYVEYTGGAYGIDYLSNGFKIRDDHENYNKSGDTYIYMAFAEAPLVGTNNVPANAR